MELDTSRRVINRGGYCREFAPGGLYFNITYREEGVNLPEIDTLVYLGMTQVEFEKGQPQTRFMFQHSWSYQQDGSWVDLPQEKRKELQADGSVFFSPEEMLPLIADIDGLLARLSNLRDKMRSGLGGEGVLPPGG